MSLSIIKNLVISGGGAAGFAFYGALKESEKRGLWNIHNIDRIYSTSAGSMVAVIISLGYDWETLDDYLIKRPWQNVYKCELPTAIQSIKTQGLFSKTVIQDTFTPLFNGKDIPIDINLEELYEKTNKDIHFITTEYETFEYVDISYKTHPKWKVIDAIYASSCLPILFSPFYMEEKVYIDGGIRMNYPLQVCLLDGCDPNEILGIRRVDPESNIFNKIQIHQTIFDYIFKLFIQYTKKVELIIPETKIKYEINIAFSSMDLNAIFQSLSSEEERIKMIHLGIKSTNDIKIQE
jgi:predicted acylesterase/phospholipase RssA